MNLYSAIVAILLALLIFVAVLWIYFLWSYRILIKNASKLSSALPTLPIIGSAHYSVVGWDELCEILVNTIDKLRSKGVNAATFWLGPIPLIGVLGNEDVIKTLKSSRSLHKGEDLDHFRILLGDGLLTAPGDIWKIKRRALNPLFYPNNVNLAIPQINKNCSEFVKILAGHINEGPFDVMQVVLPTAMKSIIGLLFGADIKLLESCSEKIDDWAKLIKTFTDVMVQRSYLPWLRSDVIFNYLYRKEVKQINDLKNKCYDNINENVIKARKNNTMCRDTTDADIQHVQDRLSLLNIYDELKAEHVMTDDDALWNEIVTMFAAGSETVSVIISTCLLQMATNQDMQERLYQEISSSVDNEGDIILQDLYKMPYLEQVVKETLRWATISPVTSRKAEQDIEISLCTIPAGTTFFLCLRGLLMDSKSYPEPTKFDPERFSPERIGEIDMKTLVSFGSGPRLCIGKYFAEIEIKLVIAHVLRRFRVSTAMDVNKLKRRLSLFFYSKEGYLISLEERTK